jgi:tripartite-type tricarboxylate transporter receptor subunit TctC
MERDKAHPGRCGPLHTRRSVLCALSALCVAPQVFAQGRYPDKPIRVIVPFGAGTSPDVIARSWGDRLSKLAGQPVIIDNKAGAASIIGTQAVTGAPADGYTLLYTVANTVSINPFIYKNLPYKAEELAPVSHILSVPLVMIVPASSPYKSVQDLVAAAKARPGTMNYASYGVGTSMHVAMARFLTAAGISMAHVPYKDGALTDLISGVVDVSFEPSTTAMGHIKAGKVRALGVSSPRQVDALPGVPPIAQSYSGFVGDSWHGVFVRNGTPAEVVEHLNMLSQKVIESADFRKQLTDLGLVPAGGSTASFKTFLTADANAWSKVVRDYAIKAD